MKLGKYVLLLSAAAVTAGGGAEEKEKAKAVSFEELVRDLGDERYPVRVRASHELWGMGDKVEALLREAAASADPEVAIRAQELLRKIQLGILPDSPPEVVSLVVRYDSASALEREKIIRALKGLRAWRQVLKIHELEKDPDTLRRIASEMEGVSVEAAREVLTGDEPDFDEAKALLEMGRPEPRQLMSLADFHRVRGTLDAELERARKLEGQAGHLWRYALLSAKGEFEEAAGEAEAAGDLRTAARLRLLAGNPISWVQQAPVPRGEIPPDSIDAYRKSVEGLWNGRPPSDRLLRALAGGVKHELDDESWHSLSVLYALGQSKLADPLFAKLSPSMAFFHFDNTERVSEALDVIGIDPVDPDYLSWINEKFERYLKDPDDAESEAELLFSFAGFLERRGLKQVLLEGYVEPLTKLGRDDPERFIQALGELFSAYSSFPVSTPVFPAATAFAGDDDARWSMVRTTLFGDGAQVRGVWDSFETFQPDMSPRERLELLAALLGRIPDVGQRTAEWWKWISESAEEGKKLDRANDYGLMLAVALSNPDANRFIKTAERVREAGFSLDELGVYSDEYRFAGQEILCLGAAGKWEEVAKHWQDQVGHFPSDPMKLAYLAGALRRAGQPDEAADYDDRAERLALGDPGAMRRIGQAYASAGEFQRAADWWLRAAGESVEDDGEFYYSALLLMEEAKYVGNWNLAASLGEMYLLYQVMRGDSYDDPASVIRGRMEVEIGRSLARLGDSRSQSIETLDRCHKNALTDGSMADYFFPALRKAGLGKLHDEWFEDTWEAFGKVLNRYPGSHNTMNTAAWTASRANRRLDEAEKLVSGALEILPNQAAYLDTYGEIFFARGNREKAVEWSDKAMSREPGDDGLLRQNDRFRHGDFPAE
ncbi:tetratricopeptide repeat-containing protein [Haloferula helveola]|uniref:Tetratricopeptide repeat-containing protein n=1 Tax=Haloferula helveola TaxID=490095 RepID=A0ABN6H4A7_9BACT|nr:tetratricopeptide repeat-containing protein [Haloferula helveola]